MIQMKATTTWNYLIYYFFNISLIFFHRIYPPAFYLGMGSVFRDNSSFDLAKTL